MDAKELLHHIAFECVVPSKLNRHTLKARDLSICKYYCTTKSFETYWSPHHALDLVSNQKNYCMKCIKNEHKDGSVIRRQCEVRGHIKYQCHD